MILNLWGDLLKLKFQELETKTNNSNKEEILRIDLNLMDQVKNL